MHTRRNVLAPYLACWALSSNRRWMHEMPESRFVCMCRKWPCPECDGKSSRKRDAVYLNASTLGPEMKDNLRLRQEGRNLDIILSLASRLICVIWLLEVNSLHTATAEYLLRFGRERMFVGRCSVTLRGVKWGAYNPLTVFIWSAALDMATTKHRTDAIKALNLWMHRLDSRPI